MKEIILFSSDWHLGLRTAEIDRTKEIIGIGRQIILHGAKLKKNGNNVKIVLGGDIFNTNTPSEIHIACVLKLLDLAKKHSLKIIFIDGNHDSIADPTRLSCLHFLKELKLGYPNVTLIQDIKFSKMGIFDTGPLYFTFLPHISKATIENLVRSGKLKKTITPQEYINGKCGNILKKVGVGSQHIVFSHLNVKGAHPGSEEDMLKRSDVYLPSCFTNTPIGYITPTIIQAHIHSNSVIGNINIIGSPIYCGFGESGNKYFAEIDISGNIGNSKLIKLIPTNHVPFKALELVMLGEERDFFDIPEVNDFLEKEITKDAIVKFDITINPENNNYDWRKIRSIIEKKYKCVVKQIDPRVIFKRKLRSVEQVIGLTPKESVKIHLKKNLKKDKEKAKRIFKLSLKYLGE